MAFVPSLPERILEAIRFEPLDDDVLAWRLGVPQRQSVNQAARRLEAQGRLRRFRGRDGKIVNALPILHAAEAAERPRPGNVPAAPSTRVTSDRALGQVVSIPAHGPVWSPETQVGQVTASPAPTLLLVSCVKEKRAVPAPARDLYSSALFQKERAYAESSGLPWFILSAEHGLVSPDEWLSPYERYLPETPTAFRRAWGLWVTERLDLLAGPLDGRAIEVHAGTAYVEPLREPLAGKGASVYEPLEGLTMGQRLAWYGPTPRPAPAGPVPRQDVAPQCSTQDLCRRLTDMDDATTPEEFRNRGAAGWRVPGLYSWWVDAAGASDLTTGLGLPLNAGLIYAGLAGATRWPSGRKSTNTLWSRIVGMHLGGRHEFSTFRRTLGSILAAAKAQEGIDEAQLTEWMNAHLKIVAVPFTDADTLGHREHDVLESLDPPLNLQGMTDSPIRTRLKELRTRHSHGQNTMS